MLVVSVIVVVVADVVVAVVVVIVWVVVTQASHSTGHALRIPGAAGPELHSLSFAPVHSAGSCAPLHSFVDVVAVTVVTVVVVVSVPDVVVVAVVAVVAVVVVVMVVTVVSVAVVVVSVVVVIDVAVVVVVAVVAVVVVVDVAHFPTAAYSLQRASFTVPTTARQFRISNLQVFAATLWANATQSGVLPHAAAHTAALLTRWSDPATWVLKEAGRIFSGNS